MIMMFEKHMRENWHTYLFKITELTENNVEIPFESNKYVIEAAKNTKHLC